MAIRLRRGLNTDRLTIIPEPGEPLWTTDTKRLYIGDGSLLGGHLVGGGGTGDVVGPSSSVNNNVVFFDGTTGKLIKDSGLALSPAALTRVNDTNVTLTLGGTPSTALLQATSITVGWIGTLADSRITSASTWNAKQAALSGTGLVKSTAGTISYISGTSSQFVKGDGSLDSNTYLTTAVTSVGLSMPSAFSVSSSPITTSGTIAVTGAGTTSQYIRGDGSLATYNPGSGSGGASQVFYFNGSVASGVTGYKQMSTIANTGASADFTISSNGYIASFLTDVASPNQLNIPAGNWNFEIYFNSSSAGGSPSFYVELYKYNGSFTLISSSSANPEYITNGTAVDLYTTALTVPATTLLTTDRLAIRVYVVPSGRTITMHTQDSNLSEVITTFSTGITALNGLTDQIQYFATPGNTGTSPNWSSVSPNHTLNIPLASTASVTAGLISKTDYDNFTTAYTDRLKWDGGATGLVAATGRTSLGLGTFATASYPTWSSGTPFVKMTAAGTFALDTNTYLTSAVTSVAGTGTVAGLTLTGTVTSTGNITLGGALSTPISTINDSTIVGQNFVKLTNPSAITFPQINADNTVSALDAATFRGAIGAGTSSTTGTVTSVSALTLGTSGTDLTSTVATGATTPVITLNVPTASATNRGVLLSTDWTTFNNKESSLTFSAPLSRATNTISIPAATSSVNGYLSSTDWSTFNNKQAALSGTGFVKISGTTISYDSSTYLTTASAASTYTAKLITANRQTASYTLVLTDADKIVEMNVATANNLTVPLNSSVAFSIGTQILLAQYGAGQTTLVPTSGVTIRSAGAKLKLSTQYSGATLIKIATDEWYLFGDITT